MTAAAEKLYQQPERPVTEGTKKAFFTGRFFRAEEGKIVEPRERVDIKDEDVGLSRLTFDFADNWQEAPQPGEAQFNARKELVELDDPTARKFVIRGFTKINEKGQEVRTFECRLDSDIKTEGWDAEEDEGGEPDDG